ncbi:MAG TPA: HAMP domain-containing sensor histidine kinase [Solirubrobacteraceae bacterium]|nr:HAMP domain-containing sensor histidine kinase [Solirubrobacteraceae bacterium]
MSLRNRIAAAAALAVAAVAVAVAVIGYESTRSQLVGQVQHDLRIRAQTFLRPHGGGGPDRGQGQQGGLHPGPPDLSIAPGYFQIVNEDGTVQLPPDEKGATTLPVTQRVLSLARSGSGSFFYDTRVSGHHLEIYSVWDAADHHVVQVSLDLSGVDSELHGLLLPYGLLIGVGILLAAILGLTVSRTALAPIERFLRLTEDVTGALERPQRLEETGASELRRLASSFNQTLDALERSVEAQRNLVADASHELRTPIAALRSNIQIFLDSGRLPLEERESLQSSILAELDELTQVVSDVVELARGAAPGAHREPIELDAIVREAVERTARRAPQIDWALELEQTVIDGAPDLVTRAVTNVVDNARKWSPADGRIEVRLAGGTLSVRDHGPGFHEADLPHVFDRFYRAPSARRLPGSGLGLAIVQQTARSHGGSATAQNAPGGGALVHVSFGPMLNPSEPGSPAAAASAG